MIEAVKEKWAAAIEPLLILLIGALSFSQGRLSALSARGGGLGGECLFLLLPLFYYIGKQIVTDVLQDFTTIL